MRLCANISLLFAELPMTGRFQAAKDAGFAAVEIQFPYAEDLSALVAARERADIPVVLINSPTIAPAFGIACRPEHRAVFAAGLAETVRYAEALGARKVNVLAGQCAADEREACLLELSDNLRRAIDAFAPHGIAAQVELLNPKDAPGYVLADVDSVELMLRRFGGALGFQLDVYHLAQIGADWAAVLKRLRPFVRHVQFADSPGRGAPGTGVVEFGRFFAAMRGEAFDVGAEYRPGGVTAATLGWMVGV